MNRRATSLPVVLLNPKNNTSILRSGHMESLKVIITVVAVLGVYILLQRVILPKMGIST